MHFKYVTSMSKQIYDDYGKHMLESFDKYWPEGEMWVYSEDKLPRGDFTSRIIYKDLFGGFIPIF